MRRPNCICAPDHERRCSTQIIRDLSATPPHCREPVESTTAKVLPLLSYPERRAGTPRKSVLAEVLAEARLPGLDGLRAIGVLSVVIAHARFASGLQEDFGPTAFFVLSGFLITRLLMRARERSGAVSLPRFYLGRTLRIFPAYYVFLLVSYFLDARAGQLWSPAFLGSALSYGINYFNAFNHHPTTSLAHAWSLGVEEQFYLLWPLAFVILARRGRRALVIGVSIVALAAVAWRSWLFLGGLADVSYVYNAFDTRLDNLAIGCLLALAVDYRNVTAVAEWCGKRSWFPIVTLLLLLTSRGVLGRAYHYSIGLTIDSLLVAILIVQVIQLHRTRLWRWLEWPVVRYVGAISYPMYLYHAWGASLGRRVPGNSELLDFAAGIVATIMLASVSYYLIERPFLKLKRRRVSVTRAGGLPSGHPQPLVVRVASA
jgi:peptidoglycan/LPS O-acetylase OafA/YrhL